MGSNQDLLSNCFLNRINADLFAKLAVVLKADQSILKGKQRIVLANAYIGAGMDLCAALTDQDVAGQDELAICALGPKAFAFAVTAVAG